MSKNENQKRSYRLSVIRKKISDFSSQYSADSRKSKDKNSANFILLAIIFSAAIIANFPVMPTDISAPANSAAAATAAECFLVLATENTEDTEITTKIKTAKAYRSTRSQTPACGFSLTQAGNFSAIKNERPTSNVELPTSNSGKPYEI